MRDTNASRGIRGEKRLRGNGDVSQRLQNRSGSVGTLTWKGVDLPRQYGTDLGRDGTTQKDKTEFYRYE